MTNIKKNSINWWKKISSDAIKNYKTINIVILCINIYLLFILPLVSGLLERISPALTKCSYLQITGKPCPLCGGTRFLRNIGNAFSDISYLFNIFGFILLLLVIEMIFRIINLKKKKYNDSFIKFDIILHCLLLISYILYSIFYIFINLNAK